MKTVWFSECYWKYVCLAPLSRCTACCVSGAQVVVVFVWNWKFNPDVLFLVNCLTGPVVWVNPLTRTLASFTQPSLFFPCSSCPLSSSLALACPLLPSLSALLSRENKCKRVKSSIMAEGSCGTNHSWVVTVTWTLVFVFCPLRCLVLWGLYLNRFAQCQYTGEKQVWSAMSKCGSMYNYQLYKQIQPRDRLHSGW